MEWQRIGIGVAVVTFVSALLADITFGAWQASALFYRMNSMETRFAQIETREEAERAIIANSIIKETEISVKLDDLKELIRGWMEKDGQHQIPSHN